MTAPEFCITPPTGRVLIQRPPPTYPGWGARGWADIRRGWGRFRERRLIARQARRAWPGCHPSTMARAVQETMDYYRSNTYPPPMPEKGE